MRLRSPGASYTKDGKVYSALQRKEIVERNDFIKDGITHATYKVVGYWTDYKKAEQECFAFNRKQMDKENNENSSSR